MFNFASPHISAAIFKREPLVKTQKILFSIGILLLTSLLSANESVCKVGDAFPQMKVMDQFEQELSTNPEVKNLMMVFDMELSKKVKEWLSTQPEGYLDKNKIVYIADISKMPRIITFLFANRKMRQYPFRMGLIKDEEVAKSFPVESDKVLVISQSPDQKISAINRIKEMSDLQKFFESAK
jgi:hypothetical protein